MEGLRVSGPKTDQEKEALLCVDLDGTLVATDLLWESLLLLLKKRPLSLVRLPAWLLGGRAHLKRQVAARVVPDPACLPYREDVLDLIGEQSAMGVRVVLATASDCNVAGRIASHLGLFSTVLASNGRDNLKGSKKLQAIRELAAGRKFDYAGDAAADLPLWEASRTALLVNPSNLLLRRARRVVPDLRVLGAHTSKSRAIVNSLRPIQWSKNFLLFVPLILSHRIAEPGALLGVMWAFVSFSLCASAVYIINDLLDLEADRGHPRKRNRPLASGALQITAGLGLIPILLALGLFIAVATQPSLFLVALIGYLALSSAYSLYLKRLMIVDVLVLGGLYTLRLITGGIAVDVVLSQWLLAFSLFLFFSLAFVKRYSELRTTIEHGTTRANGRDYDINDWSMVGTVGPASGYLAVLVLALYINSDQVSVLYQRPEFLWLLAPALLYWITRIWFLAHRGVMADDPIVFTIKDRVSYLMAAIVVALGLLATLA